MLRFKSVCAFGVLAAAFLACSVGAAADKEKLSASAVSLNEDWQIQSSCEAKTTGQQVSAPGFAAIGWHKTTVPNTVVGTLVDDKTYPDPTYGTNFKKFPGMNYSDKSLFANQDMPEGSPFRCSWWWRKEFALKPPFSGDHFWLHIPGINYRANVWVNGKKIADAKNVAGTYRIFEFDVTSALNTNGQNAVALEIFAPGKDDLGITWVDWNPTPADKDMGIWKEVTLSSNGPVAVQNAFAKSKLGAEYKTAELTLSAELRNQTDKSVRGTLVAEVDGQTLKQDVELAAGETKIVRFAPAQFPQLKLEHPKLWMPYTLGPPNLYTAELHFHVDGAENVSDRTQVTFGIREFTSELTEKGHRLFKLNGRNILIRGAAWAPDMFL